MSGNRNRSRQNVRQLQPWSGCNRWQSGSVAGFFSVLQLDFKTLSPCSHPPLVVACPIPAPSFMHHLSCAVFSVHHLLCAPSSLCAVFCAPSPFVFSMRCLL